MGLKNDFSHSVSEPHWFNKRELETINGMLPPGWRIKDSSSPDNPFIDRICIGDGETKMHFAKILTNSGNIGYETDLGNPYADFRSMLKELQVRLISDFIFRSAQLSHIARSKNEPAPHHS